jgi:hypothetical protein
MFYAPRPKQEQAKLFFKKTSQADAAPVIYPAYRKTASHWKYLSVSGQKCLRRA